MDITELKAIIDANIFENTSQAITGDALNDVLNLIADSLGEYVPVADIFDEAGTIRSALLPSYVDDVLEFSTRDAFPAVGEGGKIYLAADTNLSYRWGGSEYVIIAQSLALGETSSTAYRGDRGKIAYDHSQTSHRLSIAGLEVSALGGSIDTNTLASALSIPELRRAVAVHIGDGSIHITADERTAWNKIASYFYIDEATGNLITDRNVIIRKNLTVGGDTSTGGKGEDTGVSGTVTGIRVDANTILEPTNGIVDMSDVLANIDVDLSNYYTKQETTSEIAKAVTDLNLGQYAKASELATHIDNSTIHITANERNAWNNKWDYNEATIKAVKVKSATKADSAEYALTLRYFDISNTNYGNYVAFQQLYTKSDFPHLGWFNSIKMLHGNKAGFFTEIATSFTGEDGMWRRSLRGGIQSGWYKILDSGNYNSYSPKLDGTGASGTWGINISGNAETATKLQTPRTIWGQSFDGTGNVSGALMGVTDITASGNATIGGDVTINGNLIVKGDTTTGGTGSDAGTSGTVIGIVVNGQSYKDETNGMLDLSTLMNQYALTSAIPSLEGYAKIADVSAALAGYQPLITASNKLDYSLIANTPTIPTNNNQLTNGAGYITSSGSCAYATSAGNASTLESHPASYFATASSLGNYLPLSGGTMTGDIYWSTDSHGIYFFQGCGIEKWLGYGPALVAEGDNTDFWIRNGKDRAINHLILHAGNYTSYTVKKDGTGASGTWGINISGNAATATRARYIETLNIDGNIWYGDNYKMYAQWLSPTVLELKVDGYKTLAWQAKELHTARTIWGKSFDGTANISGALTEVTDITASGNAIISGYVGIGTNSPSAKLHVVGNAIITGDTATGSDIRFKDIIKDHRIALESIAQAPLFTFKWNDREDKTEHLGTSAQYWEDVAPWLVKGTDFKVLDYSTLGVAIGISLANKTVNLEERVKILERENEQLKKQIYGS